MTFLSKQAFLSQSSEKVGKIHAVDVPSGGKVGIARVNTMVIRDWRLSLRDSKGQPIKARSKHAAELFLARVLYGAEGLMFTAEEVLSGTMERLLGEDVEYLTDVAYQINGIGKINEFDAEKNYETTEESESSTG